MFQHCKPWSSAAPAYGRFWVDVPGQNRQRKTVSLGICRTSTIAKQKLRELIDSTGVNSKESFTTNTAPATTFRAQAESWIASLPTRRRKPVKPSTIVGWKCALDNWILPNVGDKALSEVSNGAVRDLVEKMSAAGLAEKTIVNYTQVVKLVMASAVDADGDQIYPRKWNHDFIGLPIVKKEAQHRQTVTKAELESILSNAKGRYKLLIALLAGTGLRIGEALGLKIEDFSDDCRVLRVKRGVWRGKEQSPKTSNALRVVDIPERLADCLREYVAGKVGGFLFSAKSGRPLQQRNVLRSLHASGKKIGFHAFRRFRTETLRRARVPEDLTRLWLGHAKQSVTDLYASGLENDERWRQEWCERARLGFDLVGLQGLQNGVPVFVAEAA